MASVEEGRLTASSELLRYALMKLTRELDLRFESLRLSGRVSKWYSEIGNEATTVVAGLALEPGDTLCTLHRDLGAILAVYLDPARAFPGRGFGEPDGRRPEPEELLERLARQLLGKAGGFSDGIERSFHYGYLAPSEGILHVGMISHLGAMIPVAAGCAFALKHAGSDRVAINFIGDGGTSTGDFHEGLNLAAVWRLPLVLIVENNRYAFSTPTKHQYACRRLSDRGVGYGIEAETADGNDPDEMAQVVERAIHRARRGEGPTLIEAMLGRMRGHSEGDDSLKVLPEEDLTSYLAADPLSTYEERLEREGLLDAAGREGLGEQIELLIETAIDAALDAEPPPVEIALRPVFAVGEIRDRESPGSPGGQTACEEERCQSVSYIEAICRALTEEMERDDRLILMGQDIGVFEGAFRATRGLYERWPSRVLDTPIAESGTLGAAIGASLLGNPVVVEMQFADFVSCGFNQLVNVAAKLFYRWQTPCPIVVRLPSGGGVNAGPFHSQNPEAWFTHCAGLKVVCPATATDAGGLLKAAIRDPNPVIFCEHKYLYRRIKEPLPKEQDIGRIGEASVLRQGKDLTMVAYGAATWVCLEAAEELVVEGFETEVVDLRTLSPFDERTVMDSVRKTGRALIVHEAAFTSGFGGEVAARLADLAFPWLDAPIRRLAFPDRPVPWAKNLEHHLQPSSQKAVDAARELLRF